MPQIGEQRQLKPAGPPRASMAAINGLPASRLSPINQSPSASGDCACILATAHGQRRRRRYRRCRWYRDRADIIHFEELAQGRRPETWAVGPVLCVRHSGRTMSQGE